MWKYPKLLSIGLGFLKNYFKDIKEVCSENAKAFSWLFALVLVPV